MLYILVILLAILFIVFFSGMETAYLSSNRVKLEFDKKQEGLSSEIVSIFNRVPGQYFASLLIGKTLALVIFGQFFIRWFSPVLSTWIKSELMVMILLIAMSALLIIIVSDLIPRTIFIIADSFFLRVFSVPALFFLWLFRPVSSLLFNLSCRLTGLFSKTRSISGFSEDLVFLKTDIDQYVAAHRQPKEDAGEENHSIRILRNALDFSNVRLRECMVPRTEIQAIEVMSGVPNLKEKFIETQHSRILVFEESIDNIIGYFDIKDIYSNPPDIRSGIRKLAIVPETMPANKLLRVFVEDKKNIALVVDEFGGTSGIVTIEDVLEEIVGDIEDEHDISELTEKVVGSNEYIFSGRLEIDYLNEKYKLGLPEEDDYETLAGLILFYHGSIPGSNDVIRIGKEVFKVLKVTNTRVELINLKTK